VRRRLRTVTPGPLARTRAQLRRCVAKSVQGRNDGLLVWPGASFAWEHPTRRRTEPWEIDCRDATERVQAQLTILFALEREITAGLVSYDQISSVLDDADGEAQVLAIWWPQVQKLGPADVGPKARAALAVFQGCLPALVECISVLNFALGLLWTADRSSTNDVQLAGAAVQQAHYLVEMGLLMLSDTPALKTERDLADSKLGIEDFAKRAQPFHDLMSPRILKRLQDRREELGSRETFHPGL
jgi:hypothetical protein